MTGDGGHEISDRFGFLATVEFRWHVAVATRAAFGDRVEHERAATGFGRDLRADPDVEVRAHAPDGVGAAERVTESARVGEQHPPVLLLRVQVHSADPDARLV